MRLSHRVREGDPVCVLGPLDQVCSGGTSSLPGATSSCSSSCGGSAGNGRSSGPLTSAVLWFGALLSCGFRSCGLWFGAPASSELRFSALLSCELLSCAVRFYVVFPVFLADALSA